MGDRTGIEWTDATWNPIRARNLETGGIGHFCIHASDGCRNCYAEAMQQRRFNNPVRFAAQDRRKVELFLDEQALTAPLGWKKPRMIFVCSMTDLFGEFVPADWIDRLFAVMALCPQHNFQVLTKRAARMREYFSGIDGMPNEPGARDALIEGAAQSLWASRNPSGGDPSMWLAVHMPLPNVWLGVSAEDQANADTRIPDLLATPAAIRFVSYEPALGPVDLSPYLSPHFNSESKDYPKLGNLDWVIAGGESGPNARPAHPDWFRAVRDQCAAAGVPFFFKQWGEWAPIPACDDDTYEAHRARGGRDGFMFKDFQTVELVGKRRAGRLLDGRSHDEVPA